jgi:hypothetical protein
MVKKILRNNRVETQKFGYLCNTELVEEMLQAMEGAKLGHKPRLMKKKREQSVTEDLTNFAESGENKSHP